MPSVTHNNVLCLKRKLLARSDFSSWRGRERCRESVPTLELASRSWSRLEKQRNEKENKKSLLEQQAGLLAHSPKVQQRDKRGLAWVTREFQVVADFLRHPLLRVRCVLLLSCLSLGCQVSEWVGVIVPGTLFEK